jgi:hypothetical protein
VHWKRRRAASPLPQSDAYAPTTFSTARTTAATFSTATTATRSTTATATRCTKLAATLAAAAFGTATSVATSGTSRLRDRGRTQAGREQHDE